MARVVEYFFSPVSPWTYLGARRFFEMADRAGAAVLIKPCDFNQIFAASGGVPVGQRPKQRQAYRLAELARWRDFLGIPLNLQPKHFPVSPALASCMIIAADRAGQNARELSIAFGRAVWAEERDISDPAAAASIADGCGCNGEELLAAAGDPAVKSAYQANTQEAIERQVFGAPTYIYKGELFWGQDRLDFLERALRRDGA
jgi:2-hydroxychromene-2-carboxylate isomerase